MKKFSFYSMLFLVATVVFGCSDDYDDTELRNEINKTLVGFENYDTFYASSDNKDVVIKLPTTLTEEDYTTITATMTNENGTSIDIQSRSAATDELWGVQVTKPTFTGGIVVEGSAKVTLTAPTNVKLSETALLKVTLTDKNGKDYTVTRPVKYFDGEIVENTAGGLDTKITNTSVTQLALKGSIDKDDIDYIKESLTSLEILDLSMTDLTVIPDRSFAYYEPLSANTTLKRVILPATVTTVGEAAFANCSALETLFLDNVQNIGKWAFEGCTSLRDVRLGNKLETISEAAFTGCTSLQTIEIPATVHELPDFLFADCEKLEQVTLPNSMTSIGECAFVGCLSLKGIDIPTNVTVIREETFDGCKNLQYVTLHNGITEIKSMAFSYCTSLTRNGPVSDGFELPLSLTTLGEGAFYHCENLQKIDLSKTSVTKILKNTFSSCLKLSNITLPPNLETIGVQAFFRCSSFSGLYLPASVTSIEKQAFFSCDKMTQLYSKAITAPTIHSESFEAGYKNSRTLITPTGADYSSWNNYFGTIIQQNF